MIKNYFTIAWRNLARNKVFSIIKMASLSIGLTVCMLIFLYSRDEISYDQFHANKAHLYRIIQHWKMGKDPSQAMGITNPVMGPEFQRRIPEVKGFVRLNGVDLITKKNDEVFTENPMFVDSNFFSLFTFTMVKGNKQTALQDIYSVVLSEDMARKYFGNTNIIGKTMQLKLRDEFEQFKVTGVTENAPQNSTIKTGMLLPLAYLNNYNKIQDDWIGGNLNTFVLLAPQADTASVLTRMQSVFEENTREKIAKAEKEQGITLNIRLALQPFTDIHLSKEAGPDNGMQDGSKPLYSYILSCIAVFILVIACINFINLAVAQSLKRGKEVGVRKVIGGSRQQLIWQFLTESFCITLIAFVIAICTTAALLPFFNVLANKKLSFSYLADGYLFLGYFALLLITSVMAGFYPSLVLSSIQPVRALYGRLKLGGRNYLTRGLIVLQFALAIFLIIGTIAINSQLKFLSGADLGYDPNNLVRVNLPFSEKSDQTVSLFKDALEGQQNILSIGAREGGRTMTGAKANGKNIVIEDNTVDENFLPTYKLSILAGRNFSPNYPSDSSHSIIVNESFVKEAGWTINHAIGQTVTKMEGTGSTTVIGVIKNYHYSSLKDKIGPEAFRMKSENHYGQIWVRIKPDNIPQTLSMIEKTYKKIVLFYPYTYAFMGDINAKNYETETKWKQIINIASILFIFISCIGLLGLVILSIEHRTKEIGIRKVLGAAASRIVFLVSKEFIFLIAMAFVVATPLAYYTIYKWLEGFAYRIPIGWWMFAAAGISVVIVAMLTMGFQALKAAWANPVKSLKSE